MRWFHRSCRTHSDGSRRSGASGVGARSEREHSLTGIRYCFVSSGSWYRHAGTVRLRELGRALAARGVDVSYVVDDVPHNREHLGVDPWAQVEYVAHPHSLRQLAERRASLRQIRPDYVHVLDPAVKLCLALIGSKSTVVADWDEWPAKRELPALRNAREKFLDRWLRRRAWLTIVCSRYLQERFLEEYGIESVYVPYAAYLRPEPDGESPFAEHTAVAMGNFYPAFDHDVLFEAALLLSTQGLTPRIVFLGDGPDLERWRAFVRDRGLVNVSMPGYVSGSELWRHLRHAHVILFPIRRTVLNLARCPSKAFAYAQARRPVITNRVGEVERALGDRGIYVDCSDVGFASAIAKAFESKWLPDIDYGVEPHTWAARADAILDALAERRRSEHHRQEPTPSSHA